MTRFLTWPCWAARCLLALLVVAILSGLSAAVEKVPTSRAKRPAADSTRSDQALFQQVALRVQNGEGYYDVTADEHRLRSYPLFPFVAVRPPALTYVRTWLGSEARFSALLMAIAILSTVCIAIQVHVATGSLQAVGIVALVAAIAVSVASNSPLFHDAWASVLVTLALAVRSERHFVASAVIASCAVLIRELALPFVIVMLVMALYERRWRETLVWVAVVVLVCIVFWVHAAAVDVVRLASDLRSPGWSVGGGWPFVMRMTNAGTSLMLLPVRAGALFIPLALIGWMTIEHQLATRATLYLVGMIAAFMFFGRPDNEYWGILLGPLLPIGLVAAPHALWNLARASMNTARRVE